MVRTLWCEHCATIEQKNARGLLGLGRWPLQFFGYSGDQVECDRLALFFQLHRTIRMVCSRVTVWGARRLPTTALLSPMLAEGVLRTQVCRFDSVNHGLQPPCCTTLAIMADRCDRCAPSKGLRRCFIAIDRQCSGEALENHPLRDPVPMATRRVSLSGPASNPSLSGRARFALDLGESRRRNAAGPLGQHGSSSRGGCVSVPPPAAPYHRS